MGTAWPPDPPWRASLAVISEQSRIEEWRSGVQTSARWRPDLAGGDSRWGGGGRASAERKSRGC
eukprot:1044808-Prorocentrum_minimum.AAC.3